MGKLYKDEKTGNIVRECEIEGLIVPGDLYLIADREIDPATIPEDPRAPGRIMRCELCDYVGHPVFHPSGTFGCPQCERSEYVRFHDAMQERQ